MKVILKSLALLALCVWFVPKAHAQTGLNCYLYGGGITTSAQPYACGENNQSYYYLSGYTVVNTQTGTDDGIVSLGSPQYTYENDGTVDIWVTATCNRQASGLAPVQDSNGIYQSTTKVYTITETFGWDVYPDAYSISTRFGCTGPDPVAIALNPHDSGDNRLVYVWSYSSWGWVSCELGWTVGGYCGDTYFPYEWTVGFLP